MAFSTETRASVLAVDTRAERFVDAARDLANETGSSAFTVAQVTARAGLSLKSFYACFGGKDDLLVALLATESQVGAGILEQQVTASRDPDPVHAYVTGLFEMLLVPGAVGYAGVLVREHRRLVEHDAASQRAALAPLIELLARLLDSPDPERDPSRDADTMFAILLDGIHDVVVGRSDDPRELGEYLYGFCMFGVRRS
jgi:AcrR family transcriptional regulator